MKQRSFGPIAVVGAFVAAIVLCVNLGTAPSSAQGVLNPPKGGGISGVTAGSGLVGGGTSGTVTLNVGSGSGIVVSADAIAMDPTYAQRRITGVCTSGNAIQVVNQDGSVGCQAVGSGDVTAVTVGAAGGLTGGGTSGDLVLTLLQGCSNGQILKFNGTSWQCGDDSGGITNAAGSNVVMKSDGSNAVPSKIYDDSSGTVTVYGNILVNSNGSGSAAAGFDALISTHFGSGTDGLNIFIGGGGQLAGGGTHTLGSSNTSMGKYALNALTTGQYNSAFGHDSMVACDTCIDNTGLGQASLLSLTSGIEDTCIGVQSCELMTNGSFNTAVGLNALQFCNGQNNTALGVQAGESVATASANVYIGEDAGQFATGSNSTIVGTQAGLSLTSGNNNTFVGEATASGITTGRANTIIGALVAGLAATLSNNVIIADGDGNVRIQCDNTGACVVNGSLSTTAHGLTAGGGNFVVDASGNTTIVGSTQTYGSITLNTASTVDFGLAAVSKLGGPIYALGAGPTLSSCGTSPSSTTGTTQFTITVGTGTATTCTATFATACATTSTCSVSSQSSTRQDVYVSAESASAVTISNVAGANLAGLKLDVFCVCH